MTSQALHCHESDLTMREGRGESHPNQSKVQDLRFDFPYLRPSIILRSSSVHRLLNENYYSFLKAGIRIVDGVPIVGPEHLVPLKARAWFDLTERKAAGETIDRKNIRKHRNDVFRLCAIIDPAPQPDVPHVVREDMRRFLDKIAAEAIDLKSLGIGRDSMNTVVQSLGRIYGTG